MENKRTAVLDDSIFTKTQQELTEEYKEKYGEYPKPLTDEEKKEYGLI